MTIPNVTRSTGPKTVTTTPPAEDTPQASQPQGPATTGTAPDVTTSRASQETAQVAVARHQTDPQALQRELALNPAARKAQAAKSPTGGGAFPSLADGPRQVLEEQLAANKSPATRKNITALASDTGFASLPVANQEQMARTLAKAPSDVELSQDLRALAGNSAFRALPDGVRDTALQQVDHFPDATGDRRILTDLVTSPGFAGLGEKEQQKILTLTGGTNKELGRLSRVTLAARVGGPEFTGADAAGKTKQLQKYLVDQPGAPDVAAARAQPVTKRVPYMIGMPTDVPNHPFQSGVADAKAYNVEVAGKHIPVTVPAAPGPTNHTVEEVTKALAGLPAANRAIISDVTVNPGSNPMDAYWRAQYGSTSFNSFMTAGSEGKINIFNTPNWQDQATLDASLLHETGHIASFRAWGDSVTDPRWVPWANAVKSDGVVTSRYARNNVHEDFAETLVTYQGALGTAAEPELKALMPERYRLMDNFLSLTPPARTP